ncbi:hypothetical protein CLOM_g19813 [Closterium sp. NIES-68]|nr:hypothetical protein CLOM_g19813 [Closterium sp. NIES-68]
MSRLPPLSAAGRGGHSIRAGTYEDVSQHMPGSYAAITPVASANRRPLSGSSASGAPGAGGGAAAGGGFNSPPLKPLASVKLRRGTNEDASQLMPEIYRVGAAGAGTASEMASELDSVSNGFSFITLTSDAGDSARTAWMSPAANLAGAAGSGALQRECADVFKGQLLGCNMAIKRLEGGGWQGPSEYSTEVEVLSRMRHPHIVLLMGHCPDPQAMCILYEYLPGGSLQEYLSATGSVAGSGAGSAGAVQVHRVLRQPLAWYDRVRILSEVSGALLYLHQHSPPIVHRDLKPDNVLLDGNRMSKLGDVGLARLIAEDDYNVTARVQGTVGYIDPEEVATCEISVLSDVYAFGLIVLQLLMGEPQVKLVHRLLADTAVKLAADQSRRGRAGGNTGLASGCGNGNSSSHGVGEGASSSEPRLSAVDAVLARLDKSGGEWHADVARHLAVIGVRCADRARARRPGLEEEVQPVLMRLAEEVRGEGERGRTDVDSQLLCPISQRRMMDPVVAADGYTYERYAIEQWLECKDTSPTTGMPFPHRFLTPNNTLRILLASQ